MTLDRRQFLPAGACDGDFPVPLSETCSVPSKRMAYLLAGLLETDGSVLEIGTGSAYQTAILAEWHKEVVSIEANPHPGVRDKLPPNVMLIEADGCRFNTGHQFDAVLVTFGVDAIAPVWIQQLKDGARLVVPLHIGSCCRISVYTRRGDVLYLEDCCAYAPFTQAVN